jgi:hypothetical protein
MPCGPNLVPRSEFQRSMEATGLGQRRRQPPRARCIHALADDDDETQRRICVALTSRSLRHGHWDPNSEHPSARRVYGSESVVADIQVRLDDVSQPYAEALLLGVHQLPVVASGPARG